MSGNIVNTHFPGIPVQDGVDASFCAVCVQDDRGFYAVYVGIGRHAENPVDRLEVAGWVAQHGTKLRYRDALQHFPQLPENRYRA